MNPLRTLLSIFPQPLHAFMSQGRFYVYISARPDFKFDNRSTTLSLAPGKFDNPYKGAEAGCQEQQRTTKNKQETTNKKQQTRNKKRQTRKRQTRNKKQETTNKKQETTNKKQETKNNKQETRNNKQETRTNKQEIRNNKQETTNKKPPQFRWMRQVAPLPPFFFRRSSRSAAILDCPKHRFTAIP